VGRLDYNTTGVLLLTNDGEMSQALAHPSARTPRVYQVRVQGQINAEHIERLLTGVQLDDGLARAVGAKVMARGDANVTIQLTLHEGRYQEVRRMIQALGFRVSKLTRLSFAGLTIEGLAPGAWRSLTSRELARLKRDYLTAHKRHKGNQARLLRDEEA
jgi:23S rRNA pseudouridine2605 synthase